MNKLTMFLWMTEGWGWGADSEVPLHRQRQFTEPPHCVSKTKKRKRKAQKAARRKNRR